MPGGKVIGWPQNIHDDRYRRISLTNRALGLDSVEQPNLTRF
jgi:hypothetical protein